MTEAIPSCGAHFVIIPLRNDVVVPQQDAVERSRSRLEIGAVLGEDYLIDHGVDRWVFDAKHVGRAAFFGGPRPVRTENSNSDIMVMQSTKDRVGMDTSSSLNWARERRVLL